DGHALGAQHHRLMTIAVLQRFAEVFQARLLQIQVHGIRRQIPVVPGLAIELAQHRLGGAGDGRVANQLEMVAAVADFDAEALLDHAEVFIELAAETGEAPGVDGLDAEAMNSQGNVQISPFWAVWRSGNHSIARKPGYAKTGDELLPALAGGSSWSGSLYRFGQQAATQGVGQGLVDVDIDELADQQRIIAAEVDDAVMLGAALQHARVLLRIVGHQDALGAADHAP